MHQFCWLELIPTIPNRRVVGTDRNYICIDEFVPGFDVYLVNLDVKLTPSVGVNLDVKLTPTDGAEF